MISIDKFEVVSKADHDLNIFNFIKAWKFPESLRNTSNVPLTSLKYVHCT